MTSEKGFRVLVLGDAGTGKTSLIKCFASGGSARHSGSSSSKFSLKGEVYFTDEQSMFSDPARGKTLIVDFSARAPLPTYLQHQQDERVISSEIKRSDVICIVCDLGRAETMDSIDRYWIPLIRRHHGTLADTDNSRSDRVISAVPIIIAENKIDLIRDEDNTEKLDNFFLDLCDKYTEIESCIKCSATENLYVESLFKTAERAIVFPYYPLCDPATHRLTNKCKAALKRVFKLLDRDKDGALNDDELEDLQSIVSTADAKKHPLTKAQLDGIKLKISKEDYNGVNNLGCVTFSGFLTLNLIWISHKSNTEPTWLLLYAFGYATTLEVSKATLYPPPPEELRRDNADDNTYYELSASGIMFLRGLFEAFDKDNDGYISQKEVSELLSVIPPNINDTNTDFPGVSLSDLFSGRAEDGMLDRLSFVAQFHMLCYVNQPLCLRVLAFLGFGFGFNSYSSSTSPWDAFVLVEGSARPPLRELNELYPPRRVYMCYVLGSRNSGKTSFLRCLAQKNFSSEYDPTNETLVACRPVTVPDNENDFACFKYLCATEFENCEHAIRSKHTMRRCDVAVILTDVSNPYSFGYALGLHNYVSCNYPWVPCLHVFSKADKHWVKQISSVAPETFFKSNNLPEPRKVKFSDYETVADLFGSIVEIAKDPGCFSAAGQRHRKKERRLATSILTGLKAKSNPTLLKRILKYSVIVIIAVSSVVGFAKLAPKIRDFAKKILYAFLKIFE